MNYCISNTCAQLYYLLTDNFVVVVVVVEQTERQTIVPPDIGYQCLLHRYYFCFIFATLHHILIYVALNIVIEVKACVICH
jgi:hypothetical protein